MNIESFLKIKPRKDRTKKVKVTIQDIDLEFEIKALDLEIIADIKNAHTITVPPATYGGPTSEGANPIRMALDIVLEATLSPSFKNAQLQDHFGNASTEIDCLRNMFKGEDQALIDLMNEIISFSTEKEQKPRNVTTKELQQAKNS